MRRTCPRNASLCLWSMLIAMLLLVANPLVALAQDDAATPEDAVEAGQIDRWRVQARLSPRLFGPEDGPIEQNPDRLDLILADARVRDFFARVDFTNPSAADDHAFDYGFLFRVGRDADFGLYVTSNEQWIFAFGGQTVDSGDLDDFDVDDGGQNELEIAVVGDDAFLAVNGEEVAAVDVSRRTIVGDVAITTAFTTAATNEGVETLYEDFQVWSLEGLVEDDAAAPNPSGEELLDEARDVADQDQPASEPERGDLAANDPEDGIQLHVAGIDVVDFYTRFTVLSPRDDPDQPWDVGIGFRDAGENDQYRLTIASDGTWYFSLGVDAALQAGAFDGLETAVDAENEVELAVSGDAAAVAVNGAHIATLDLAGGPDSGDVWLATGLYGEDAVAGATTAFEDFTVWDLSQGAVPADATPEATETVESERTPTAPGDEEETFNQLLTAAQQNPSLAGPDRGEIDHDAQTVFIVRAGVDEQDFAAHATFTNPYPTDDGGWDYGIEFRLTDETHYRLYVTSREEWLLTLATEETVDQGTLDNLDLTDAGENELDLVVVGDIAYFAVNGEFVATLDVSGHTESGDVAVATAFLDGDFIVGETTPFSEFEIWPLADEQTGPEPTADAETPEATEEPTEEVETPEASPQADGEPSYTSPTYGFSITWDETWEEVERTSGDGIDSVRIENGVSTVDLYGYATPETPSDCLDGEFEIFQTGEGYSDAEFATDDAGDPLREEDDDRANGVFLFTFTPVGGAPIDYQALVECRSIEPGESMALFIQFVTEDDFGSQEAAGEELLATLTIGEAPAEETPTPEGTETAVATATAEAAETPAADAATVGVRLNQVDGSGVSGLATLTADGDRTSVSVLAIGAEPGAIVLIQSGGCDSLDPAPAHLLRDLDDAGSSETTVNADLAELQGGFAITIHADVAELTQPIACGEIPGA